jgi:uncharacterized protein (DUF885 family)
VQSVRQVFQLMPQAADEDWDVIAARLHEVPKALASYTESLATGASRGLFVGPTQVGAVVEQLGDWLGEGDAAESGDAADRRDRGGWFEGFVAAGPDAAATGLDDGAHQATDAVRALRDWLRDEYGPQASEHGRDPVGAERYARYARYWTGADLDLQDAYDWAWTEFAAIDEQLRREAARVLPGSTPLQAMRHLDERGEAIEGVEEVRAGCSG